MGARPPPATAKDLLFAIDTSHYQPRAYARILTDLSVAYADDKHDVWTEIGRALRKHHEDELMARMTWIRERGLALARLKRLCEPGTSPRWCLLAANRYKQLERFGPHPPPSQQQHTVSLDEFIGDHSGVSVASGWYAKISSDLLEKLQSMHLDVRVQAEDHHARLPAYNFQLIGPGEPEHTEHAANDMVGFSFVGNGSEMLNAVQLAQVDIELHVHGYIYVGALGRDLNRKSVKRHGISAVQLLLCASLAAFGAHIRTRTTAEIPQSFLLQLQTHPLMVKLGTADRGDGKLLSYYREFGFDVEHIGSKQMSAPLDTIIKRCSGLRH